MFEGGSIFDNTYGGYDGGFTASVKNIAAAVQLAATIAIALTAIIAVVISLKLSSSSNLAGLYAGLSGWLITSVVVLFASDAVRTGSWPSLITTPLSQLN